MELRRLRYFVVAAEESNFRCASLRLETNSSIISRHVRDIDEELGADLFHREPGHHARLTEVGRAFLNDVREMFGQLDHAKATAQAVAYGKRGRLRLAASEDVMTSTLARIITAYREQWPEVHLDLLELPAVEVEDKEVRIMGSKRNPNLGGDRNGGWGGIRTHGELAPTPVFKTGALNRSATHPSQIFEVLTSIY
jgi:DNA-binding transcriptional LysR family regulator